MHQVRLSTTPGEYELSVSVQGTDQQAVEIQRDLLVPDFSTEGEVSVSDVTLAISIEPSSDRDDLFFKNGLVVRPNANQIFGSGLDQMFYYAEVYGADVLPSSTGNYSIFAYIAEANVPQPMPDYQKRIQRPINTPDVLIGSFDVSKLPSGSYFLRLAILSEDNEAVTEQSRKFFAENNPDQLVYRIPDPHRQEHQAKSDESAEADYPGLQSTRCHRRNGRCFP